MQRIGQLRLDALFRPARPQEHIKRLLRARTRDSPIGASLLADMLDMPEREVRDLVKGLVEEEGCPIGSRTDQPAGYYWMRDPEEIEQACRSLWRRAMSILRRYGKLRRMGKAELARRVQRELWEDGEC